MDTTNNNCTLCIDVGNNYLKAIVYKDVQIKKILPAIVTLPENENKISTKIGYQVKEGVVVKDFNNLIGIKYSEYLKQRNWYPFDIAKSEDDYPKIAIFDKHYYPEEILALLIKNAKEEMEEELGNCQIKNVILNNPKSEFAKSVIAIAGLNLRDVVTDQFALSFAYRDFSEFKNEEKTLIVVDLGVSALKLHLIRIENNEETYKSEYDSTWSSNEFTSYLCNYMLQKLRRKYPDFNNLDELKQKCDKAKITLSKKSVYNFIFDVQPIESEEIENFKITREEYEKCIRQLVLRLISKIKQFLRKHMVKIHEVSDIITVGGSSKIPIVKKSIEELFDRIICDMKVDSDFIIVHGICSYFKCKTIF